ncbi:leucine-rich_repeat protein [Hexamita inflata]|nr:leucine-rich repeat protein [Hexamita inflata]
MIKMKILNLSTNALIDLTALAKMTQITELILSNNKITNIAVLENMKQLLYLQLSKNQLTDINKLSNNTALQYIYLNYNKLKSLDGLQNVNLLILEAANNCIEQIDSIQHMSQLKTLILDNNFISKLCSLRKMTRLQLCNISNNEISNSNEMQYLVDSKVIDNVFLNKEQNQINSLETVQLDNKVNKNNVKNTSYQETFKNIYSNKIVDKQLVNIQPIAELLKLQYLCLKNNKISMLQPLLNISEISYVGLSGNPIENMDQIENMFAQNVPNNIVFVDYKYQSIFENEND